MLESSEYNVLKNVTLCGVMGIATFTDKTEQVREEFISLRNCYNLLKEKYFRDSDRFREISMGMSGDYPLAVEAGSTIVRIGSLIFGDRIT